MERAVGTVCDGLEEKRSMQRKGQEDLLRSIQSRDADSAMRIAQVAPLYERVGFGRGSGHGPTRYPVACEPQAWSAGVVFHLITGMLGLAPAAAENRLTLDRLLLPPWLKWLELHDLRLGKSRVALRAAQGREGAAIELLARYGDVEIVVRR